MMKICNQDIRNEVKAAGLCLFGRSPISWELVTADSAYIFAVNFRRRRRQKSVLLSQN